MKENRLTVTGESLRSQGLWQNISQISQLTVPENVPVKVWLKDPDFPVLPVRLVFIDKDRYTGTGFPVSNDFTLSTGQFATLCKKRWSVDECHKSVRQNASAGSSPARSVRAQSNHLFASVFAFVKLEKIKRSKNLNHFAVKAMLYLPAVKIALSELNAMIEGFATA